jgi:hypothetical protein
MLTATSDRPGTRRFTPPHPALHHDLTDTP